jgi:hypothetical protein
MMIGLLESAFLGCRRGHLPALAFFNAPSQTFFHRVMTNSQHDQDVHLDFAYQDVSGLPYPAIGNPISGMPKVIVEMAADVLGAKPIRLIYQIGDSLLDKSSIPSCRRGAKLAG